jgi:hypothetical protein
MGGEITVGVDPTATQGPTGGSGGPRPPGSHPPGPFSGTPPTGR